MTRIAVTGAAGRMGSRIIGVIIETHGVQLTGALERSGHPALNKDAGVVAGSGDSGVFISSELNELLSASDVVIDFTSAESSIENLRKASSAGKAMVIGSTGFTTAQMDEIGMLSRSIPCVISPNMSIGVNVMFKILSDAARILGDNYDVEIVEAHHRMKKDAPSGTAMRMAEVLADALGRDLNNVGVYARHGIIGERSKKEIGIQTLRAGDIVGDHTVMFGGMGERLEFTHRAHTRDTFARGAVRAAQWISGKRPGLYDMQDVLGLKE